MNNNNQAAVPTGLIARFLNFVERQTSRSGDYFLIHYVTYLVVLVVTVGGEL